MANQRKLGVVLSYASQFAQVVINFVYTPIMLRLVGQSEYGLYQMVFSVVSYLNLLNFGFNAAYIRYYTGYKARADHQGIATLNGMFLTIFSCIAAVAAIAGSGLVMNIEQVLGGGLSVSELSTARSLMILMVINLVVTFPCSVFECYVVSQENFIFQQLLVIGQYILNPIFTLPLLMLGYGSIALISVTTAFTCIKLLVNIFFCVGKLKMRFCFRGFKFSLLLEMGSFTFFIFLGQIIDQINWSIDKILLGRYLGTVTVAIYGLAATINSMYLQFSMSISHVFIPEINKLVAEEKDNLKLTELFAKVGRFQFLVLALILIGFISIGKPFMCLWGGLEYAESYYVALFLMIPVTIALIQNLGIDIQRAKNMHQARSVIYFFIALGNAAISVVLIPKFGAVGAALGTAIALLVGNGLFMNWYYHKKIGLDIIFFWKEILAILPSLLLPGAVGVMIFCFATITNWLYFVMYGVLIVAAYCFSVYNWGLNPYEKELFASICAQFRRKA